MMEDNYIKGDYMSHSDLHLGDWVYYETPNGTKKYGRICELGSESAGIEEEKCRTWIEYEDIKRIPITPETLELFGFTERGSFNADWSYQIETRKCPVVVQNEGDVMVLYAVKIDAFKVIVDVNNIHEIQHCMEVAGIEKELEYNR